MKIFIFLFGLSLVIATLFSALSTFVLPRAARSQLNRIVFGVLRRIIAVIFRLVKDYARRDKIMAYYAPIGLLMLVPAWYALIALGYAAIYWALGAGDWLLALKLSGSSLFTLGFIVSESTLINVLIFSEAMIGLILVALLMAYLPTMYSAFSRREQAVNMLEVRAGNPPTAREMLLRFNRIHGLDKLSDYWKIWESWFADVEESHTTLPALVFFRSPRAENSWITSAGAVLDAASLTLSSIDIPFDYSAALSIRAGFIAMRRIADYFDISYPTEPRYPQLPISIRREEFDAVLDELSAAGVPIKENREQAWLDFAGWRVNYDRVLLVLCSLVMAPETPWSSDRAPKLKIPALFIWKKK